MEDEVVCSSTTVVEPSTDIATVSTSSGSELEEENTCPLFMVGLPRNFKKNKQLAALASLMNDETDDLSEDTEATERIDNTSVTKSSTEKGVTSKIRRRQSRARRRQSAEPYPNKKASSSIGEANLFLKMWKL